MLTHTRSFVAGEDSSMPAAASLHQAQPSNQLHDVASAIGEIHKRTRGNIPESIHDSNQSGEQEHKYAPENSMPTLNALVADLEQVLAFTTHWDEAQQVTVRHLREAVEHLQGEALRRLIRVLQADAACHGPLRAALSDEVVYAVLRFHGLVKASLGERIQTALASVQGLMQSHGGGVELVAIRVPDTVEVRLLGACHGCPASSQTLTEGVERAIREHCPEITRVVHTSGHRVCDATSLDKAEADDIGKAVSVHFVSPFALAESSGWCDLATLQELPDRALISRQLGDLSLLLYRRDEVVSCLCNACAHMGMPLDGAQLDADKGVLTCPFHGFQYLLETGECLTVPEVQLQMYAVRVLGQRIQVRLS